MVRLIMDWIQVQGGVSSLKESDTGISLTPKHPTHSCSWEMVFGMDILLNLVVSEKRPTA